MLLYQLDVNKNLQLQRIDIVNMVLCLIVLKELLEEVMEEEEVSSLLVGSCRVVSSLIRRDIIEHGIMIRVMVVVHGEDVDKEVEVSGLEGIILIIANIIMAIKNFKTIGKIMTTTEATFIGNMVVFNHKVEWEMKSLKVKTKAKTYLPNMLPMAIQILIIKVIKKSEKNVDLNSLKIGKLRKKKNKKKSKERILWF